MALSASCIATWAIATSQEVTGPVFPEASTASKAITSQSVIGLARARIVKAASQAMTNKNSATAPRRIDLWIEPEFMIPSKSCRSGLDQATFIPGALHAVIRSRSQKGHFVGARKGRLRFGMRVMFVFTF